jgi:iron complex transport system substrate-binding protein
VLTDGIGRTVRLPKEVRRVISLAPSSTEILCRIGARGLIVGRDRYSDYPSDVAHIESVGAEIDPNLERIVALQPDVVLVATSANAQATVATLERLGLAVWVSRSESLADVLADIEGIGRAVGREQQASTVVSSLRATLEAVARRAVGRRPTRVLLVVWPEPLVVAGRRSHVSDLIAAAGGVNVAADADQPFPSYSVERVLERAPEVVIVGTHSDGPAPSLAPLLRLTTLPAVRDHRVLLVDGDLLFRPGPRVVDGIQAIASAIEGRADGGAP